MSVEVLDIVVLADMLIAVLADVLANALPGVMIGVDASMLVGVEIIVVVAVSIVLTFVVPVSGVVDALLTVSVNFFAVVITAAWRFSTPWPVEPLSC